MNWIELTNEIITELESTDPSERYWLATTSGDVISGEYQWKQGWSPHGFNTEIGRIPASKIKYIVKYEKPTHPDKVQSP